MTSIAVLVLIALLAVAIVLITPSNTIARILAAVVGVIAVVFVILHLT